MSLRINQNIGAMNAHRFLQTADAGMAKSIERLSSGFRINSAADDAAGLVISEQLRTQVSGLTVAQKNTQDGINMIKTAEAALNEIEVQLRNMRDLTLHAANNMENADMVSADAAQVTQAIASIDRISTQTEFAGVTLLATGAGNNISGKFFQIGANDGQQATFTASAAGGADMSAATLGVDAVDADLGTAAAAADFDTLIGTLDTALGTVNTLRVELGAFQKNNLESNLVSIGIAKENIAASESAIRDTDMAEEMMYFTKNQILMQAASAMMTQANQAPQAILQMLR